MGFTDKAKHKAEDLSGKGKESAGRASNDPDLEAEGRADQSEASVKNAGEHVKDAGKNLKDGLTS